MNPRERVKIALNFKEPDRVPIDLGGTVVSSIAMNAYTNLKRHLGMHIEGEILMLNHPGQVPYLDEALLKRFSVDFRNVQMGASTKPDTRILDEGGYYVCFDRWGSKLQMPKDGGLYFDWVEFPIVELTMDVIESFNYPYPDKEEVSKLQKRAQDLYTNTDYVLVGSAIPGDGIFNQPTHLMGMENWLMLLMTEAKLANRLMEKITETYIEFCNNYLDEVGAYIQVFAYWDDICTKDGWLISPALYRKMIKPKQRRLVEAIKRKTDAKLMYHSDGAASNLIPDLIEIGFDIFNPVQFSARGMDTKQLKKQFGKDIVFWGGGVDTQHTLPFGEPEEVVEEVKKQIDILAPGGGFVFAAVHNIQADVSPENIIATFDTAVDYGVYRS